MASSEGNYQCRGPYFGGTNFASWKHKMKMHIRHNPAIWAVVHIGLQGDFFEDGREPDREATAKRNEDVAIQCSSLRYSLRWIVPRRIQQKHPP